MHDVILIELFEGFEQLPKDNERLILLERLLLLKQGLESAAVAVLINKVKVVGRFQSLDESDDVLVLESGEDIDFVDGELFQFGVRLEGRLRNDLHCIVLLRFLVDGSKDLPVDSLPDGLLKQIILN